MTKHILVVDDDKDSADTTVMAIAQLGEGRYTAEAVYGGKECLLRVDKTPPVDLILLDLNMPEPNGADVIRTLLKKGPPAGLKVLPTTAWGPGWIKHWNLTGLNLTPAFQALVTNETCDKATDLSEMMDQIRKVLGEDAASAH